MNPILDPIVLPGLDSSVLNASEANLEVFSSTPLKTFRAAVLNFIISLHYIALLTLLSARMQHSVPQLNEVLHHGFLEGCETFT